MTEPAVSKEHKHIGIVFAMLGFLALAMTIGATQESSSTVVPLLVAGCFLLACAFAFFTVYAVGVLMRNHELWLRSLAAEDTGDSD